MTAVNGEVANVLAHTLDTRQPRFAARQRLHTFRIGGVPTDPANHDELAAGRATPAPTMCPSSRCSRTATSCPAGYAICRRTGLPDQAPSTDIERTIFASVSVRPPFSPRTT